MQCQLLSQLAALFSSVLPPLLNHLIDANLLTLFYTLKQVGKLRPVGQIQLAACFYKVLLEDNHIQSLKYLSSGSL